MSRIIDVVVFWVSWLFLLLCLMMLFPNCSTIGLPKDATGDEKRAALCMDATAALAMAEVALTGTLSGEAMVYWTAFAKGARLSVDAYCAEDRR